MQRTLVGSRSDRVAGWAVTAVLGQVLGLAALGWLSAAAGAVFREPLDYGCYQLDTVPAGADEGTDVNAGWQWWPLGLRCSAELTGGAVVFRDPALSDTAAPLFVCGALAAMVLAAIYQAVRAAAPAATRPRTAVAGGLLLLAEPAGVLALLMLVVGVAALNPVPLAIGAAFGVGGVGLLWTARRLVVSPCETDPRVGTS